MSLSTPEPILVKLLPLLLEITPLTSMSTEVEPRGTLKVRPTDPKFKVPEMVADPDCELSKAMSPATGAEKVLLKTRGPGIVVVPCIVREETLFADGLSVKIALLFCVRKPPELIVRLGICWVNPSRSRVPLLLIV